MITHSISPIIKTEQSNVTISSITQKKIPPSRQQVIQSLATNIALSSLKELAVSFAFTGVTCFFVATPAIPTLLLVTISIVTFNVLIRITTGVFAYQLHRINSSPNADKTYAPFLETGIDLLQCVCPLSFTVLDQTTRDVLIHEMGHALTATAVYQNARPTIEIFPIDGGETRFFTGPMTWFGNFLGEKRARLLICGAGPAAAILAASVQVGLSHHFEESHPNLSLYLLFTAITSVVNHVLYALSALWLAKPEAGHDFAFLWSQGNIHPLMAAITMVAIPIIVKSTLFAIEHYRKQAKMVNS